MEFALAFVATARGGLVGSTGPGDPPLRRRRRGYAPPPSPLLRPPRPWVPAAGGLGWPRLVGVPWGWRPPLPGPPWPTRRRPPPSPPPSPSPSPLSLPPHRGGAAAAAHGPTMVAGRGADAGFPPPRPPQPPRSLPFSRDFQLLLNHPVTETALGMLVLLTCAVVALETLPDLDRLSLWLLTRIERVANVVFFVEFMLRWYSLDCRPRELLRKLMLIDLVACLPLFFSPSEGLALQVFQLLRVARVLRLQRAIEREDFTKLFTRNKSADKSAVMVSDSQLRAAQVVLTVFTLLYFTSGLTYAAENQVNPQFSNFFSAFYFASTALTTVGLGDIAPITPLGRAVTAGAVISGAFLVPLQLGSLARATMSEMGRPARRPPPATPPDSLLTQLGDYGMVDLDAADAASAPVPVAAALLTRPRPPLSPPPRTPAVPSAAAAPPPTPTAVVAPPLAAAAAAVVATPAAAAAAGGPPSAAAWNLAFMDAPCTTCGLRVHQLDARYCRLCGSVLRSPPRK